MTASDRKYIAFISYRHKPNDMKTAKAVHQLIEHYRIPDAIAQSHGFTDRKFGKVFRDEDELPISDNLSANITEALDASEYLIVICTPDLPESSWCKREITYFMENHSRSHVLAVLADGTPETSFPDSLTHIYDEETHEVKELIEPLAANICGKDGPDLKLLKREIFRLYAAMIPCAFDDLWQRERRYQTRRKTIAAALAGCLLLGYTGTVVYKNHQIQNAYDELETEHQITLRNESEALAALSASALSEGDRTSALQFAFEALPYETDRPYSAVAEKSLSDALYLYQIPDLRFDRSFDYEVIPHWIDIDNEKVFFTGDDKKTYCVDGKGNLIWENEGSKVSMNTIRVLKKYGMVLAAGSQSAELLDIDDGSVIHQTEGTYQGISDDGSVFCVRQYRTLVFIKTETGETIYSADISDVTDLSIGNTFDCTFSDDNTVCLISIRVYDSSKDEEYSAMTFRADLEDQELSVFSQINYNCHDYEVTDTKSVNLQNGNIFLFAFGYSDDSVRLMTEAYDADGSMIYSNLNAPDILPSVPSTGAFLEGGWYLTDGNYFVAVWKKYAALIDMETGKLIDYDLMESDCVNAFAYADSRWHFLFANGTLKFVYPESFDKQILEFHDIFSCGFNIADGYLFDGSGYEMAVIPEKDLSKMEFLKVTGDSAQSSMPWLTDQDSYYAYASDLLMSEDGRCLQYIESSTGGKAFYRLHLLDQSREEVLTNTYPESLRIAPVFAGNRLYFFGDDEYIWDLESNTFESSEPEIPFEYDYVRDKHICGSYAVYELCTKTDDSTRGIRAGYALCNIGTDEWALIDYHTGDTVESYPSSAFEGDVFAAGGGHFYIAGPDQVLYVYSAKDGTPEKQIVLPSGVPYKAAAEDKWVLIEDTAYIISLMNIETEEVVYQTHLDSSSTGLHLWTTEERIIVSISGAYGEGHILDKESGREVCTVPRLTGFDRSTGILICYDQYDKKYLLYPMLSTYEAADRAAKILRIDQ